MEGKEIIMVAPGLLRPKSRGTITLKSKNPFDLPIVDPNFLDHPDDVKLIVKGEHQFLISFDYNVFSSEDHSRSLT